MTDRAQFEEMLEALINEDHAAAQEIFHNIVVAKSREIYEELLAEDFPVGDDEEDEFGDEDEAEDEFGDEAEDEFGDEDESEFDDEPADEFGDEDEELEDRVLDLEDALEELKAEFENLLAGEEEEPEHDDMFGGEEDEFGGEDEFGDNEFGDDEFGDDEESEQMFEYTDLVKVASPKNGDNGVNNKSPLAKPNNMGGNVISSKGDGGKGGTQGGLLNPASKPLNSGNVNTVGSKNAVKLRPVPKGHGSEKKGAGETATNSKSPLGRR